MHSSPAQRSPSDYLFLRVLFLLPVSLLVELRLLDAGAFFFLPRDDDAEPRPLMISGGGLGLERAAEEARVSLETRRVVAAARLEEAAVERAAAKTDGSYYYGECDSDASR